jgi:hypothetical protein
MAARGGGHVPDDFWPGFAKLQMPMMPGNCVLSRKVCSGRPLVPTPTNGAFPRLAPVE